ncbi:hypothetical protein HGA88_04545 [Candidatus Roizmanbacteria bacterium]|nr:hypothetical protein [Candidatus Roizmanbacteria bacterium]
MLHKKLRKKIMKYTSILFTTVLVAINIYLASAIAFYFISLTFSNGNRFSINFGSLGTIILTLTAILMEVIPLVALMRKKRISLVAHSIVTFLPILWILFMFVGYTFATSILFWVVAIICIAANFFLSKWLLPKWKIALPLLMAFIVIYTFLGGFEEDYCVEKGMKADPNGSKMVIATKEDERLIQGVMHVRAGQEMSLNFKTHFECHATFDFLKAVGDSYLKIK